MFSKFFPTSSYSTSANDLDYRLIFAASCLLSVWLIAIDPIINRDAIIYLRTADAFLDGGWLASQALFDRPLLPVIFALLHKFTGIPLPLAGQLVVSLSYAFLCTSFVATIRVMGGDRRVQIFAAMVILFHPMLNASRADIMRDPAYWALAMLAFRELLLYAHAPSTRHRLRWFLYIGLASLFRFEGVFFALLSPLAVVIASDLEKRWRIGLSLLILPAFATVLLLTLIFIFQGYVSPGEHLFKDIGAYLRNFLAVAGEFRSEINAPAQAWIESYSLEDASVAAVGGISAVLAVNICRALTWPYVGVLIWGLLKGQLDRINPRDRSLIRLHLLICLLYLILFMLTKGFMLERYSGIVALYLLLYLPFVLNGLWNVGSRRAGKILAVLVLLGMTLDTLHNRDFEKAYIRQAAQWMQTKTPTDATIVSNSSYIAYFSERTFDWDKRAYQFKVADLDGMRDKWRQADYLVVLMKRGEVAQWKAFLARHSLREVQTFSGKRHGKVAIIELGKH